MQVPKPLILLPEEEIWIYIFKLSWRLSQVLRLSMTSKGFQSKHRVLWNARNKGKRPKKKNSSLSICSFRLWQLHIFRQRPTLKSPLSYQQSHSLKPLQTFNLCSAWESYRLLDGIQNPIQTLQSPWVERIMKARPVTANVLSHSTWPCIIHKSPFLLYFCPLVQWGKRTNSQIRYHPLNKTLKVAHSSWMKSTAELYSDFTTFLRRSISWYLSACIWVYLTLPNFLLQSCLSPFSLASILMRLS